MLGHWKPQLLGRGQPDGDSSALAERRLHHVVLPAVLCVAMFAWTFVQVGLPFYVQEIGGESRATTLRWIGWILGITPILTILTTPMWMRISRHSPVRVYVLIQLLQGSAFVLMALTRSLYELFAVRVLLGITGPPTAMAFLIAARSTMSPTTRATSAMQSAMTLGIITGPLAAGTLMARVGYTGSFLIGGMLLFGCALLVGRNAHDAPGRDTKASSRPAKASGADIAALCLISLVTYTQMFFIGSILPAILPTLGAKASDELQTAGWILFGSGLLLAAGSWAAPLISQRIGEIRTIGVCIISSSLCLGRLGFVTGISAFVGLRFLQALLLAPVFPMVLTRILRWRDDQAVGLINSARFAANFVGPVVATTLLSWAQTEMVFAWFAVAGFACLPLLIVTRNSGAPERP